MTRRRSGRRRRIETRTAASARAAPYLVRKIPVTNLLDPEAAVVIEDNADRILDEIGMEFRGDPETLEIFRTAGARVDGERVRFDPGWCRDSIRSAPRSFVQHARNPERAIRVGGDAMVFCPSFGPPFVHDLERGRRYSTIEDFRDLTRMHHQIPSLHHSGRRRLRTGRSACPCPSPAHDARAPDLE